MALLGFMSLSGMLIKNAIVLLDEIALRMSDSTDPLVAIREAGISRMSPVVLAGVTTVLGMIPLLTDAFFVAMAVTIMAGLTFATVLTLVLVPVLYEVFRIVGVPAEIRMPLCVGTSLAIIIPVSIRSYKAHKAKGAVDEDVLREWRYPIIASVIIGSFIAYFAPSAVFKGVFILCSLILAVRMLGGFEWRLGNELPKQPKIGAFGAAIGIASTLMGVGGGALATMVLSFYGVAIHRAVATSSGVGVLIAIPGAIGYVLAGWGKAGLPPLSLGYVSIIGVLLIAPLSVLIAPIGVRIAHSWSKRRLEIAFGIFMVVVCLRFVLSFLGY